MEREIDRGKYAATLRMDLQGFWCENEGRPAQIVHAAPMSGLAPRELSGACTLGRGRACRVLRTPCAREYVVARVCVGSLEAGPHTELC